MKTFKTKSLVVISLLATAFTFTSCDIDDLFGGSNGSSVKIIVSSNNGIDTKAGPILEQFEPIDLSQDGLPFFLSLTKTVNTSDPFSPEVKTKGTQVIGNDVDPFENYRTSFRIDLKNAIAQPGSSRGDYSTTAIFNSGEWQFGENNDEYDFPDGNPTGIDFWAFSDLKDDGSTYKNVRIVDGKYMFDYTGAPDKSGADSMSDFLVAHTGVTTDNPVNIHFFHALAAVKFKVAQNFKDKGYKYIKVSISGIKNAGTASFTGPGSKVSSIGNDTNRQGYFDWSDLSNEVTYEQLLYSDGKDATDMTMFLIPQDLTNVKMTFTIINDKGKEYSMTTKPLGLGTTKFTAGYVYNYTIGNDLFGSVGVQVKEDPITDYQKTNVKVGLTSSSAAYIRVAIVANWFTSGTTSKCFSAFDVDQAIKDGDLIWNNDDWAYNTDDHYFYSKKPVLGYEDSEVLIESFTVKQDPPRFDLHLEMNIIAQAVAYDHLDSDKDYEGKENSAYSAGWFWGNTDWLNKLVNPQTPDSNSDNN